MSAYHRTVPPRAIIPNTKKSLNTQRDDNLIIHGDNLHALKALLPKYAGCVDCIYIDPPYNTGNEGWVYNDNVSSPILKEWLGNVVGFDDMERHSKWCCMMWPRLQLLRELLAEDGVIFVSIDDNEQHRLRMMMDEIFGEENFLACIVWQRRFTRSNNAKLFSSQKEFVMSYRKSPRVEHIRTARDPKLDSTYTNPDNDPRGPWLSILYVNPATAKERPNLVYPIYNPITKKTVNHPERAWKYDLETHKKHVQEDRLWWGLDGGLKWPRLKIFLTESTKKGIVPTDLILGEVGGTTDEGTRILQSIFGRPVEFNNPKPTKLVKELIGITEGVKRDTDTDLIILDSFAGSGTTAHAVLELNKQDGGNRKFILVECEDKYVDTVTAERVRRVIKGVPGAMNESLQEGTGGSFTYCTLGKAIDAEKMLGNEDFPDYSTLAAYLLYLNGTTASGKLRPNKQGMFYHDDTTDYYLLYKPNQKFMMSSKARLGTKQALDISNRGRRAVVFAADSEIGEGDLRKLQVELVRLPYVLETER